eukprot:15742610-Heterocapsa_arctica.AAC.1
MPRACGASRPLPNALVLEDKFVKRVRPPQQRRQNPKKLKRRISRDKAMGDERNRGKKFDHAPGCPAAAQGLRNASRGRTGAHKMGNFS